MLEDLITYQEYLDGTAQIDSDLDAPTRAAIVGAIAAASAAVRSHTDRDFILATNETAGDRNYRYYGHGIIDIADATSISQVATLAQPWAASRVLDPTEWFAMPMENQADTGLPVLTYIELYSRFVSLGISPEMGFKRNLDTYPWIPYPQVVVVTGVWGWPFIPSDVKMATLMAASQYTAESPSTFYTAESIANFSRSRANISRLPPGQTIQSLPDRAVALLDPYTRWAV